MSERFNTSYNDHSQVNPHIEIDHLSESGCSEINQVSESGCSETDEVSESGGSETDEVSESGCSETDEVSESGCSETDEVSESGCSEIVEVSESYCSETDVVSESGCSELCDSSGEYNTVAIENSKVNGKIDDDVSQSKESEKSDNYLSHSDDSQPIDSKLSDLKEEENESHCDSSDGNDSKMMDLMDEDNELHSHDSEWNYSTADDSTSDSDWPEGDPCEMQVKFVKVLHENLPERKYEEALLENLVNVLNTEAEKLGALGTKYGYIQSPLHDTKNLQLLETASKICKEKNFEVLIHCGLLKACFSVIKNTTIMTSFVRCCLGLVDEVIALVDGFDKKICDSVRFLVLRTVEAHELLNKMCHFFEVSNTEGKVAILKFFHHIIGWHFSAELALAITIPKICSVFTSSNETLILQALNVIDDLLEFEHKTPVYTEMKKLNVLPTLVNLLSHPSNDIVFKTLNIFLGLYMLRDEPNQMAIIRTGLPGHLLPLVLYPREREGIFVTALYILREVSMSNQLPLPCLFDYGLVPVLFDYLESHRYQEYSIREKVLRILCDLYSRSPLNYCRLLIKNEEYIHKPVDILDEYKLAKYHFSETFVEPLLRIFFLITECLADVEEKIGRYDMDVQGKTYLWPLSNDGEDTEADVLSNDEIKRILNELYKLNFHGKMFNLERNMLFTGKFGAVIPLRIMDLFERAVHTHLKISLP